VICALTKELEEVLNLRLEWHEININNKLYHRGKLGDFSVISTSENKMGMPEAATITTRVIDLFNPKYVVMTGIAAGVDPSEQNFLDLLMPGRVFNWQSGKYKVKKEDNKSTEYEEKELHIFEKDNRIESTFISHNNTINNKKLLERTLENISFDDVNFCKPKNIFNEAMVSGSAVVADVDIVKDKINGRKVYGIDMEAYGVVFACVNSPTQPKSIIIKSICDFADEKKDDKYQEFGMKISANAFYYLFKDFISAESQS
jgi:nucleoside phosphorylase